MENNAKKELLEFALLPEDVLAHAYDLLMDGYGKHFPPYYKAQDFQSFLREGSCPACKISSWMNAIDHLRASAKNTTARGIEDRSIISKHIESIDFLDAVAGNCDYISEEADKLESAIRRLAGLEVSNG